MIGKLKGKISEIYATQALIETSGGVFFWIYIMPSMLETFDIGSEVTVYTYHLIKEDEQTLFAFDSHEAYKVFTLLISVDGVGPKTAYLIMCVAEPDAIKNAVQNSDVDFFQKMKGIGKKTAQRILVDLSGKLGSEVDLAAIQKKNVDEEAVDALVSLGFKQNEAQKILEDIDPTLSLEEKIKAALQKMAR